jgi:HK97 family phage portal protein
LQNSSIFNPYGESKLATATKSLKILSAVYDALISVFDKRGAIGILSPKPGEFLGVDAQDYLKEFYSNGYGTDKNSIMVSSHSLDYTRLVMPISEMQPIQVKDSEFIELCRLFNIDSTLLNDKTSSTYNNYQTAIIAFIEDNLKPFLKDFYEKLSKALGTDFTLEPDFTELNESMKDIKLLNEVYSMMNAAGVCDGNEWRAINNLEEKPQYGYKDITIPV